MAMKWSRLLEDKTLVSEQDNKPENSPIRTIFERDYDRLIYSTAFRRLGRKTQVHPLSENDHVHNRLSHTLETTTVGRSLGRILVQKLREDSHHNRNRLDSNDNNALDNIPNIMVAACLAHDMGNPPFGHSGEDILSEHMFHGKQNYPDLFEKLSDDENIDITRFEGNAQTFRILTKLEIYGKEGGLKLSMPTLATTIKYPWGLPEAPEGKNKFNYYQSEKTEFETLVEKLGLKTETGVVCRHPLSYLLEAADDICYLIMDFEDALDMNIISETNFYKELEPLCKKLGLEGECGDKKNSNSNVNVNNEANGDDKKKVSPGKVRGQLINKLTHRAVDIFMANYDNIMTGRFKGALLNWGGNNNIPSIKEELDSIRWFFSENVYDTGRNMSIDIGAYQVLGDLVDYSLKRLDNHVQTLKSEANTIPDFDRKLTKVMGIESIQNTIEKHDDSHYEALRMVLDYISGMTDNFSVNMRKIVRGHNL